MDGTEQVPVGQPDAAGGIEHRGLANLDPAGLVRIDLELQPQAAGDPHLRRQAQPTARLERLDPPEVDRVADAEIDRVAPAAPQSDAAAQGVHQSTRAPEPVAGVPPGVSP